jgi:hypothetical protein
MSIAAALGGVFQSFGDPTRQVALRIPVTPGAYDVATGRAVHRDPEDLVLEPSAVLVSGYSAYELTAGGGRVLAADRKVRLHANALPRAGTNVPHAGIIPTPAHQLVLDGAALQIVDVRARRVGPEVVSYTLQVRGAAAAPGYPATTTGAP